MELIVRSQFPVTHIFIEFLPTVTAFYFLHTSDYAFILDILPVFSSLVWERKVHQLPQTVYTILTLYVDSSGTMQVSHDSVWDQKLHAASYKFGSYMNIYINVSDSMKVSRSVYMS
jgi:hypothetical protein